MEKHSIQIDRFYPSSKKCNICGYQMNGVEIRMKKRLHEYEKRGMRKSPFGSGKYRRDRQISVECGKI